MPEQQQQGAGPQSAALPLTEVEQLAQEILAAREKKLAGSIGRPQKREIMSFGQVHDCDRNNFYSMAEGDQAVKWDTFVQAKMDAGKARELSIKRELLDLGYEPMMAGEVLEIKDSSGNVLARGRTDLSLQSPSNFRNSVVVEVKCMQTHMWGAISTWRDLLRNPWTRKYVRQLMLYMKARKLEEGLFLIDDFQGHWKMLPVKIDEEFIADAVKKIETAKKAVAEGKAPERITYDSQLCGMCNFQHICIPDINLIPAQKIEGNERLAEIIERRDQLLEHWKEVEKLDRGIKAFFEDVKGGLFRVGNFIINRRGQERTIHPIPDDVKEKYAEKKTIFINKIERFAHPDADTIYMSGKRRISFDEAE